MVWAASSLSSRVVAGDHACLHDVLNKAVVGAQEQLLHRYDALQHPAVVGHIAGIDLLGVLSPLADAVNGLQDGHILMQVHILRRHDAAGGILGVFEELVDQRPGLRPGVFQNTLNHHGRHFLQHIHCVIHEQVLNNRPDLLVGDGVDDGLLGLRLQLSKYVAGLILRQRPVAGDLLERCELLHKGRHIHFVGFGDGLMELLKLFGLQQGSAPQCAAGGPCCYLTQKIPPISKIIGEVSDIHGNSYICAVPGEPEGAHKGTASSHLVLRPLMSTCCSPFQELKSSY